MKQKVKTTLIEVILPLLASAGALTVAFIAPKPFSFSGR